MLGLLCSISVSVCIAEFHRILQFLFSSTDSGWWEYLFPPRPISNFLHGNQWNFFPTHSVFYTIFLLTERKSKHVWYSQLSLCIAYIRGILFCRLCFLCRFFNNWAQEQTFVTFFTFSLDSQYKRDKTSLSIACFTEFVQRTCSWAAEISFSFSRFHSSAIATSFPYSRNSRLMFWGGLQCFMGRRLL